LDIESPDGLDRLAEIVPEVDGVVSMLPYLFHAAAGKFRRHSFHLIGLSAQNVYENLSAAKVAIANKKHFFTTSYISPAIRELEVSFLIVIFYFSPFFQFVDNNDFGKGIG